MSARVDQIASAYTRARARDTRPCWRLGALHDPRGGEAHAGNHKALLELRNMPATTPMDTPSALQPATLAHVFAAASWLRARRPRAVSFAIEHVACSTAFTLVLANGEVLALAGVVHGALVPWAFIAPSWTRLHDEFRRGGVELFRAFRRVRPGVVAGLDEADPFRVQEWLLNVAAHTDLAVLASS